MKEFGIRQIPRSLEEALVAFEESETVSSWFADDFKKTFIAIKEAEIEKFNALSAEERYNIYATTY